MPSRIETADDLKKRTGKIHKILKSIYGEVSTPLLHRNAFELLVATILSAQCTDAQVNRVTPALFERFRMPADFANAGLPELERLIQSTGFYRNKARNIKACSQALVERHGGKLPNRLEEMVQLPGVGRKTANVVLGAFGTPGIVVDTHVARVSGRLELSRHKDPEKIEADLMTLIPKKEWSSFSLRLIFFGRETCTARKPKCPVCPIDSLCPYPDKTPKNTV
jgi:endonuclease III